MNYGAYHTIATHIRKTLQGKEISLSAIICLYVTLSGIIFITQFFIKTQ